MQKKETIDVQDINKEFFNIQNRLKLLQHRFSAVAMDYKHYIDSSLDDSRIYELRDDVSFRFFSAKFHLELLLKHHELLDYNLQKDQYYPGDPIFDIFQQQITSLLDSFIYHTVSVFDYLGSLTNYIIITGKQKQETLTWNKLSRAARDRNNSLNKKEISQVIEKITNEFIDRLQEHRSSLIHKQSDQSGYEVTTFMGPNGRTEATFLAGKNLVKTFSELRKLGEDKRPTVKWAAFWILNKAIDKTNDVLFALKKEMESNPKHSKPTLMYQDPVTKKMLPMSTRYWNEGSDIK